jgi:hypothetical protein
VDGRKQQFGGYATHSRRARRRRPPDALVTDDWPAYQDLPGVRHNAITPVATSRCPGSIGYFQTSNVGAWASTTDCGSQTFSTTSMNSCPASNRRRTRHAAFDTLLAIPKCILAMKQSRGLHHYCSFDGWCFQQAFSKKSSRLKINTYPCNVDRRIHQNLLL